MMTSCEAGGSGDSKAWGRGCWHMHGQQPASHCHGEEGSLPRIFCFTIEIPGDPEGCPSSWGSSVLCSQSPSDFYSLPPSHPALKKERDQT